MGLVSRKIVGWTTAPAIHRDMVLEAVLMAVQTRRPRGTVIRAGQGTQFRQRGWRVLPLASSRTSIRRKGNRLDNAVVESLLVA